MFSVFYGGYQPNVLGVAPPISTTTHVELVPKVTKIESLSQVSVSDTKKTLFLWDLDDTSFDFPGMLGSKGWRKYIMEATNKLDSSRNWHDLLSYFLMSKKHPVKAIESATSPLIKTLQRMENVVCCGLTARERHRWYDMDMEGVDKLTIEQLGFAGINFNNKSIEMSYPYLAIESGYYQGVLFINTDLKGDYLKPILAGLPEQQRPEVVKFIDDKDTQARSVARTCSDLDFEHECYVYTATDAKASKFDPLIANIQLHWFLTKGDAISDNEAAAIAKQHPDKDAHYWLKEILALAKKLL